MLVAAEETQFQKFLKERGRESRDKSEWNLIVAVLGAMAEEEPIVGLDSALIRLGIV